MAFRTYFHDRTCLLQTMVSVPPPHQSSNLLVFVSSVAMITTAADKLLQFSIACCCSAHDRCGQPFAVQHHILECERLSAAVVITATELTMHCCRDVESRSAPKLAREANLIKYRLIFEGHTLLVILPISRPYRTFILITLCFPLPPPPMFAGQLRTFSFTTTPLRLH